jgi:hypothetical protein
MSVLVKPLSAGEGNAHLILEQRPFQTISSRRVTSSTRAFSFSRTRSFSPMVLNVSIPTSSRSKKRRSERRSISAGPRVTSALSALR